MLYAASATDEEGYEAARTSAATSPPPLNLALCLYKQVKWKEAADVHG